MTNQSMCKILFKSDALVRLLKWAFVLNKFDITYRPWTVIKAQALVDFVTEITLI